MSTAIRHALHPWETLRSLRHLRPCLSQFGEDHIVRRLLRPAPTGTYLDIGAHHPVKKSNTFMLYLLGWRGITVDPNPSLEHLYRRYRKKGIHLVEGVSESTQELTYFEFFEDVLNTLSATRVKELGSIGVEPYRTRKVRCRPLRAIVEEQLPGKHIDLLSIDCEGLDLIALQSLDLSAHRPTVIVIEDLDGYTGFRDRLERSAIESYLTVNEYCRVAQTGLSSIYVARDWRALFALTGAYDSSKIHPFLLP